MASLSHIAHVQLPEVAGGRREVREQTLELLRALVTFGLGKEYAMRSRPLPPDKHEQLLRMFLNVTEEARKQEIIADMRINFPRGNNSVCRQVVASIFEDGERTLGRILALFGFAYELCLQFPEDEYYYMTVMSNLIDEYIVDWIVDQGGWEAIITASQSSDIDTAPVSKLGCFIAALAFGSFMLYQYT